MAKSYHHGDLRHALVAAAIGLLDQRPAAEIGLREVARAVGVSSAAPYRHFRSREDLMTAVAAEGFAALADRLQTIATGCAVARVSSTYSCASCRATCAACGPRPTTAWRT